MIFLAGIGIGLALGMMIGWALSVGATWTLTKDCDDAKEWSKRPRRSVV